MSAITYPIVILCIILPAVSSLFVRRREGVETDAARVRKLRIWLWTATVGAVLLTVGLDVLDRAGKMQWWHDLPGYMTWKMPPGQLGWGLSFPLWFVGFMRLVAAVRPDLNTPFSEESSKRSAALVSRKRASPLRRSHWVLAWAIFVIGAGLTIAGFATGHGASAAKLAAGLMIVFAPLPLVITPFGIRMAHNEPEPLDAGNSEELAQAYDRHRGRKILGFYLMALVMVSFFTAAAAALAWGVDGRTLGLVGGIGGSLIGLAGGAFGVTMGVDRARIKTLLDSLA